MKGLEAEMKKSKDIFDPLIDEAKRKNDKLNRLSDEKLKALNIGDQIQLVMWINYLMQGKRVCDEVKGNILNQLIGMDAIKIELYEVIAIDMPKFWRVDNTLVPKIELMNKV